MPLDAIEGFDVETPEGWDLSCLDWQDRIRAGKSLLPDLQHLDLDRKMRSIAVFNSLRIPDIPGTPKMLDAAGDWFRDIVGILHGSIIGKVRMIREAFIMIPKKNAKTTNGAALTLTEFILNERPNAQFLLVGATQAIANLAFKQIAGMINRNSLLGDRPGVRGRMRVRRNIKTIEDRQTGASLVIKTFSEDVMTGVAPAFCLLDEAHLLGTVEKAADVILQIRGGMVSQEEACFVIITTQSVREPAGAFLAELTTARDVRDGMDTVTRMLPVIYELPDDINIPAEPYPEGHEPWRDPRIWHWVTPNNGRSITVERLYQEFQTAVRKGPAEVQRWTSQHLNLQIGTALRSSGWVGARYWDAAALEPGLKIDDLIRRCEVIVGGVDGGGMDDLLGAAFLGREIGTRRWLLVCKAWAHRDVLLLRKEIAPKLNDLLERGEVGIVDDIEDAFSAMAKDFAKINKRNLLAAIGLDPAGVGTIIDALAEENIEGKDRLIEIPQGWTMQNQVKTMANKVANKTLVHNGSSLMKWCVGNAKVERSKNAIYVTKAASGTAKIDALMAAFNAISIMSRNPKSNRSVYEDRGPRIINLR